jgi:hypothetical protein
LSVDFTPRTALTTCSAFAFMAAELRLSVICKRNSQGTREGIGGLCGNTQRQTPAK